jgi:heme a synthase
MRSVHSPNLVGRLRDAVWHPTPASLRTLALAGVIANAGIIVTGAAVRVTGSGLGCPTWPECSGRSLVPVHEAHHGLNMTIEFTNRMLTYLVLAVGVAVYVAALRSRPRRRDVTRLAFFQPFSVVLQAIMGGIVVLTKLHPAAVSAHFMLSIGILAAAVALWVRTGEGDAPPTPTTRQELVWVGRALVGVVAVLLLVGTVVTGTGPHAGDAKARRWAFNLEQVAQLHADVVWVTVGLTFALLLGLRLTNATGTAQRRATELLVIELGQGVIGYVQYFTHVPSTLVIAHVSGATLVWIATIRAVLALRDRGPLETPDLPSVPQQAATVS